MKYPPSRQKHVIYLDEIILQVAKRLDQTDETEPVLKMVEAILWAIRRRLDFPKALQFLLFLPLQLQAIFVEGWEVSDFLPSPLGSFTDLADEIVRMNPSVFPSGELGTIKAQQAVRALFATMGDHISPVEAHQMAYLFPENLRDHLL